MSPDVNFNQHFQDYVYPVGMKMRVLMLLSLGFAVAWWMAPGAEPPPPPDEMTAHPDDEDWKSEDEQLQFMCQIGYIQC